MACLCLVCPPLCFKNQDTYHTFIPSSSGSSKWKEPWKPIPMGYSNSSKFVCFHHLIYFLSFLSLAWFWQALGPSLQKHNRVSSLKTKIQLLTTQHLFVNKCKYKEGQSSSLHSKEQENYKDRDLHQFFHCFNHNRKKSIAACEQCCFNQILFKCHKVGQFSEGVQHSKYIFQAFFVSFSE